MLVMALSTWLVRDYLCYTCVIDLHDSLPGNARALVVQHVEPSLRREVAPIIRRLCPISQRGRFQRLGRAYRR